MNDVRMKVNQKVPLTVKGSDASGADATSQIAAETWDADSSFFRLLPDASSLAVEAVAQGAVGTTTVSVSALDAAGNVYSASVTIVVEPVEGAGGTLSSIEIVAGTPVSQ